MTRRPRPGTTLAVGLLALAGPALVGCSGGSDDRTGVTLPSSLSAPTTEPGTSGATSTTISSPPTTVHGAGPVPAAEGAPGLGSVTAVPGPCVAGSVSVVVTYQVAPDPPVRIVTAFLDGGSPVTATPGEAITLAVPCDGAIHQVQVIATGTGEQSSGNAVAFRAPRP